MKIRPLADRILVRRVEREEKSPGGILLPQTSQEKPLLGVVVAVGPGKQDEPIYVKEGEKVLFGKWAGSDLKDVIRRLDEDLLVLQQSEILAIVEDD